MKAFTIGGALAIAGIAPEASLAAPPPANRLARESSPYLQQHAHNPVDWYPWGEEALDRARTLDRPIFLSIGYSACHWCHVMERESFEDAETARLLNERFVPIKVDREERPDLDAVYMTAVQAMTGSGGWPLSVFLTPELEPFFGGTYFPPERRWGMSSFREVLTAVADAWRDRRAEVRADAASLTGQLASLGHGAPAGALDAERAGRAALDALAASFDPTWGGFGGAPKFPSPSRLFFLLGRAPGDEGARRMLARTLDAMAAGGMRDWLGGGFHRYSVDARWLVPHFEKMLYDNALLARLYGEAGVRLANPEWVAVARETADYLLREMRGPEGGFYSSTDADSEGREGAFFTWTPAQLRAALPPAQASLLIELCGLDAKGNFEGGASVLRPQRPLLEAAARAGVAPGEAGAQLAQARAALLEARGRRVAPAVDDKRLAGWNGMAVWSLAFLGAALPEPRYLAAARSAATFLLAHRGADGRLLRSWRNGVGSGVETLEDVAWTAAGLAQLYQADGDAAWLRAARDLVDRRLPHYQAADGVVFDTPDDGPALPARPRAGFDNATPAAAAVLGGALLELAALSGDDSLRERVGRAVAAEAAVAAQHPEACTWLVEAALAAGRPPESVVVVGDPAWPATRELLAAAWRDRPAGCVIAPSPAATVPAATIRDVPLFTGRERAEAPHALAYFCRGGTCLLPTGDPAQLAASLRAAGR